MWVWTHGRYGLVRRGSLDPGGLGRGPRPGHPAVEHLERVGHLGQHEQVDAHVGRGRARAANRSESSSRWSHGADADEARRQPVQVGVDRRDLGRAPLVVGPAGQVAVDGESCMNSGLRTSKPSVAATTALARVAAPVELAVGEVETDDAVDRVQLVADAQRDRGGHVAAGRLTADQQPLRTELRRQPAEQLARDRDTVVGTGRPRELRRLAVLDRHDRDAELAARSSGSGCPSTPPSPRSSRRRGSGGRSRAARPRAGCTRHAHPADLALLGLGHRERRPTAIDSRAAATCSSTRQVGRRLRVEQHRRAPGLDHGARLRRASPRSRRTTTETFPSIPLGSTRPRYEPVGPNRSARPRKMLMISTGIGKMIVEFRSVAISAIVCSVRSCIAPGFAAHRLRGLGELLRGLRTRRRPRSPSRAAPARLRPGAPSRAASAREARRHGPRRDRPAHPTPRSARRARSSARC